MKLRDHDRPCEHERLYSHWIDLEVQTGRGRWQCPGGAEVEMPVGLFYIDDGYDIFNAEVYDFDLGEQVSIYKDVEVAPG